MDLFVPGRICLFGEHSDWAGGYRRVDANLEKGYTLISGTEQGIYASVGLHPNALVLSATTPEGERLGPHTIPMETGALLAEAQRGGFWSYIAGVAYQASVHYQVQGLVVDNRRTDLPIKKGLSSSAAICVLAARAFNRLYDLKLTVRGEMELAYQGEITTPSRCGRMDQGCAFGRRPVLMTFDGNRLETAELEIERDLHLVIVDLRAQKNTMKILAALNECFPTAGNPVQRGVQELLGAINRRLVHEAAEALQAGDGERLGQLMVEAQKHFDHYAAPACPEELTAPVLHRVLEYGPLQKHIWGGKGVGSQGDGAAQFVARSSADQQAVVQIVERELGMHCLPLTLEAKRGASQRIQAISSAAGSQPQPVGPASNGRQKRVRKAVIPAAGLGTRLFPASKAIKKELFPVIGPDGVARPAILLLVEEALQAGLEEVILIAREQDLGAFQSFFADPVTAEDAGKLSASHQTYAQRILEMGQRVSYAIQTEQKGFGHAVLCAAEAVGREPFLLMLGDHLYRSGNDRSCAQQMLDAYQQHDSNLLGLRPTPEQMIAHYGTVAGRWVEERRLLRVTAIAEKPSPAYARRHLRVPGLPADQYLTLFGLYLLLPHVFDYLAEDMANGLRQEGELQLTPAVERLNEEHGCLGLLLDGHSYDIGLPDSYVESLQRLKEK